MNPQDISSSVCDFSIIIDSITCPITQDIMVDPVLGIDGHTYERTAIERSLELKQESPLTRVHMTIHNLQPNYGIKALCNQYHAGAFNNKISSTSFAKISTDNIRLEHTISKNSDNKIMMTFNIDETSLPSNLDYGCLPQDVIICIDESGSMNDAVQAKDSDGNKLENGFSMEDIVIHAANTVAKTLPKTSRLSVICFSNKAKLLFDLTSMTEFNQIMAIEKISKIKPTYQTNIWAAIDMAINTLHARIDKTRNGHIILLTDGTPNISPARGEIETLKRIRKTTNFSASLYTFGFGYSLNPGLLYNMAKYANGCNAHIPDGNSVGDVFSHYIATILTSVVMNLQLHIKYNTKQNFESISPIMGDYAYTFDDTNSKYIIDLGTIQLGQMKNIIININNQFSDFTYYYTYKIGGKDYNVNPCNVLINSLTVKDDSNLSINKEIARYTVVEMILEIIKYRSIGKKELAIETYNKLEEYYTKNLFDEKLMENIKDQVKMAIENDNYYNRWGKLYLEQWCQALCRQICPNNKDLGCDFGGKIYKDVVNIVSDIFDTLEAPEPSLNIEQNLNSSPYRSLNTGTTTYTPPVAQRSRTFDQYNGGGGGCFDQMCEITMADGSKKLLKDVVKGDFIKTIDVFGNNTKNESRVVCVLKTIILNRNIHLVNFPSGLKITPWHPIKMLGGWDFPINHIESKYQSCDAIITLVLSDNHVAIINDVPCITLGHNCSHGILNHQYFGTSKIINDLKTISGWDNGYIIIDDRCFIRHQNKVIKIIDPAIIVEPPIVRSNAFNYSEQTEYPMEM